MGGAARHPQNGVNIVNNHLEMHNLKHNEMIEHAEKDRLIRQMQATNKKPVLAQIGRMLIKTGQQLEASAKTIELKRAYR